MKAISLWQPWASLWLTPRKVHETRHWSIRVPRDGFWLAVHAAKRAASDEGLDLDDICTDEFGPHWARELPRGAIIGRVHLVSCCSTGALHLFPDNADVAPPVGDDAICGDFSPGRFAWRRRSYARLLEPIPYRGSQGLFSVPDSLFEGKSEVFTGGAA